MCLFDRTPVSRRARTLLLFGSICLCLGVLAQNLPLHLTRNADDFLRGFLVGLSVTFNLAAVWFGVLARRNRLGAS